MAEDVIHEQFQVGPRPELALNTISGSVIVQAGEGSAIVMRAAKRGSPAAIANTTLEYSQTGNHVRIQTKSDKSGLLELFRNVSAVDYVLSVPSDCVTSIEAVSADVRVEGLAADTHIKTVSGDVVLERISGEAQVTTVSGDAAAHELTGTLTLRTTSGDGTVRASQLRHFNLNSVSGDFTVETPLQTGQHYLAKTVSGDLQLGLPPNTGATIQMKSVSGNVISDLPAEIIKSGRRHWQGRINGGGANVEMSSVSGDMRITDGSGSRGAATQVQEDSRVSASSTVAGEEYEGDALAEGSRTGENTTSVLAALERGEISVEDAMQRLEQLR